MRGQRRATLQSWREEIPVETIDMLANVVTMLQKSITVLEKRDGVAAATTISDRLDVGRIGIPLQYLLGTVLELVAPLIGKDEHELLLEFVSVHPLIG